MRLIFLFIFLNFENSAPIGFCQKDIIFTYGLTPYKKPKRIKMNICPFMQSSCCSLYDQYEIYNNWQNKIKPQLEKTYDEIGKKLILLERMIKFVMKMKWKKLIRKLKISNRKRKKLFKIYMLVQTINLPKRISQAVFLQREAAEYFMKVRSQFFCQICDGNNQRFFNIKKKQILLSSTSCVNLASNSISYSFILYYRVLHGITLFSKVLQEFSQDSIPQPLILPGLRRKISKIRSCKEQQSEDGVVKQGCGHYCRYFTMNSISPVMEGDIVFLDKTIHYLTKFIKENYTFAPPGRILAPNFIYFKQEEKVRKLPRPFPDFYKEQKGLTNEEIKQIFESNTDDETQESLEVFAKSYLNYFNPEIDFSKPGPMKVFNFKRFNLVDLENFSTRVSVNGINLFNKEQEIQNQKIDKKIEEIVDGIKNTKEDDIPNEVLDEKLIAKLNSVDDKYLKKFHRELFLNFDTDLKEAIEIKNDVKEISSKKDQIKDIELPPLTKEDQKSNISKTVDQVTEGFKNTVDQVQNLPGNTRKYAKEKIDDLQYGKPDI